MSTLPSSALLIYFKDYEQCHQTKGNKATHLIGIPFVLFSLLGLLAHVVLWSPSPDSLFHLDLGIILFAVAAVFCMRVDYKIAIPFLLYTYFNYLVARHLAVAPLFAIQIIGWIAQLYGHSVYEKKSPAFLTTIEHLFIGPMWIFAWLIGYYNPATK